MDASRFDAWTRRRFGTVAAGVITGLLGLAVFGGADARKTRKRKKRKKSRDRPCEKLGTHCNPNNRKQVCCGGLFCQIVPELGGNRCCRTRFAPCARDADCCANLACVGTVNRFCDS